MKVFILQSKCIYYIMPIRLELGATDFIMERYSQYGVLHPIWISYFQCGMYSIISPIWECISDCLSESVCVCGLFVQYALWPMCLSPSGWNLDIMKVIC